MIPIGDSVPSRTFSYINYSLIAANVAVFLYELSLGSATELNLFFFDWGLAPKRMTLFLDNPTGSEFDALLTPLSAMFIHGGWLHLLGNMLFLWVFGDNVEDAFGHMRYLGFYLICGLGAAALQVYLDTESVVPMVGASGAIAGVLGAYLLYYPRATVIAIVPFLIFFSFSLPAVVLIGSWFLLQLLNGFASIGYAVGADGGVAWWAHVGGFSSGFLIAMAFSRLTRSRQT